MVGNNTTLAKFAALTLQINPVSFFVLLQVILLQNLDFVIQCLTRGIILQQV
jgi:hypothetical protein